MAPRRARRGAAVAAAPQAAAGVSQLPGDVLVNILGCLELRERLRRVAPVCRRFRDACFAPELLHDVRVKEFGAKAVPVARSLLLWLMRHAAHVQRLELALWLAGSDPFPEQQELGSLITACVSACGAAGQLQELELNSSLAPLPPLSWLPALRSLQRLQVSNWHEVRMTADASGLPLLELKLDCRVVIFKAAARLPTALTRLDVEDRESDVMPQQLALLPSLRHLTLANTKYSSASMAALSRLTSLSRLHLRDCPPLATLAALPGLRHLNVTCWSPELGAALPTLQQLTQLVITHVDSPHELPPALGALPSLERLAICGSDEALRLPDNLRSVRCLSVKWSTAAASVSALAGMPALEELWLDGMPDDSSVPEEAWDAVWAWAARHPPLHSLTFKWAGGQCPFSFTDACLQLWQARPSLCARFDDDDDTIYKGRFD